MSVCFAEAAQSYAGNPVALHLRGMNMLYESVKERGSTIIVSISIMSGGTALAKSMASVM